jgi:DNA ligase-1
LRCGVGVETVNKARKDTVKVFKCQLAKPFEPERIKEWPVLVQPKLDGIRVLAIGSAKDQFVFYSRTGKEITSLDHISADLMDILAKNEITDTTMVFDGEVVTGGFIDTVSNIRKKNQKADAAVIYTFDLLTLREFESGCTRTAVQRFAYLKNLFKTAGDKNGVKLIDCWAGKDTAHVWSLYHRVRNEGGEGVIVKPTKGLYVNKRSYDWQKIKDLQTVDVPITGFKKGDFGTKYEHCLGALTVDFNGVEVSVGSGLTDSLRSSLWGNQADNIGRLIEVEYHEVTPDGSLRHPRFVRFRDDKPHQDGVGC